LIFGLFLQAKLVPFEVEKRQWGFIRSLLNAFLEGYEKISNEALCGRKRKRKKGFEGGHRGEI
jgi:hypothetical protein